MKPVRLTSKEDLTIYMNPIRQQLLRELTLSKFPMTPKMLANKLSISPSSVQHHIKKLMSLGVIALDHQELINGITASYYKATNVSVQIGLDQADDTTMQKHVFMQNSLANVYEGFRSRMSKRAEKMVELKSEQLAQWGDIMTGVVHMNEQDSKELLKLITSYIEEHAHPSADTNAWEFALILYNTQEEENE